ncbi:beta-ketoacyl-ACP synthase [Kaistia geumhonensis]|uniref:3-oxoacyl-[acyl-carrier-protein] synthase II n=1 Tax=Kaistia geumhonensis TaxID=410839 RepID=A0ABU0M6R2_9HYPH|nr:beta-ketoacyl-ACP synthase [Kaistia geumhonensis]MCX5478132.1 beta-ketoacyl-ACP synthase [Kaistia geumhonensis]MDQ0516652.1 3-oxoacyl-[acyl-carrier-protein] synthase II [Kaistia geumhonensis]
MSAAANDVLVTGIGLISSLGEGLDAHWQALAVDGGSPTAPETEKFKPFPVFPMVPLELDRQIPRRADQRQMETWQRLGTYTAGLALADAGLAGDLERLARMDMVVAAGGGERDLAVDGQILEGLETAADPASFLNEHLANDLRPTLFLAQLSNLLAGNISIVHKVTGSSRTFMGEEIAGVSAVEVAARRIAAGQGDLFLVGAAYNAERKDMLLSLAMGRTLWQGAPKTVWQRGASGEGGMITGSAGAFLVLESRAHAEARGRTAYAKLTGVLSGRSRRGPGEAAAVASRQFDELSRHFGGFTPAVLSGANGIPATTAEERALWEDLAADERVDGIRATQTLIGNAIEADFPIRVALAALAIGRRGFYLPTDDTGIERPAETPSKILATSWGFWRGEGMALVEAAG